VKHRYRIREIAAQAGLSVATVDRVLHERPGVRESTVREVHQAIGAGRKGNLKVVPQEVMELLQRFDDQAVNGEPDRPSPVGVTPE